MSYLSGFFSRAEYKFVKDIFDQNKKAIATNFITAIVGPTLRLIGPYLLKLQIDQLEQKSPVLFKQIYSSPLNIFLILVAITIVTNCIIQLFAYWSERQNRQLSQKLALSSEKKLYQQYETFDAGFLANPRNRRIALSIFQSTHLADELLGLFFRLTDSTISLIGILPILAFIDVRIFFIVLIATSLQTLLSRIQIKIDNQERIATDKLNGRQYELKYTLLYQFHQLVSIGGQERILDEYWDLMNQNQRRELSELKRKSNISFIQWLINQGPYWTVRIIIGASVIAGTASLGDFTAISMYVDQLGHVFFSIIDKFTQWKRISLTLSKIGFFLNLKPRFSLPQKPKTTPLAGDIIFEDIQFKYPNLDQEEKAYLKYLLQKTNTFKHQLDLWGYDRSEFQEWQNLLDDSQKKLPTILKDLTLTCKKGQITALIGRNGSGKTTATQFLLRNYDPEKGKIMINNQDLKQFSPKHIRKYVSIITQSPLLLDNFSIRDNLLLGVEHKVNDTELWQLLAKLNLKTTIKKLPKQLDSIIGDEIRLSGGQSQLITIARTFLQARPVIIFDEGTNQLDAEHESLVTKLLEEQKKTSTILLITHKLTTARRADQIFVLEQGKIIESGTHQSLLKTKGLYQKFWNLQVID